MNKQAREVKKSNLLTADEYAKNRKAYRKKIRNYKKDRRVSLGPHANFYFESYQTMKAQIQEMLHIEKGGDEQLKDELAAYNPLIPNGKELVATLMFEIDEPELRTNFLNKVGGIEKSVYIKINSEKINAIPEKDVDRTSEEGKASSVQFVHFKFSDDQIEKFKDIKNLIFLGIDHDLYNHVTQISEITKKSLISDFI
jgi:hypothetical protein